MNTLSQPHKPVQWRMLASIALWACLLPAGTVIAAELIMIEQEGCVFCEKFNREIAPGYAKTSESKRASLRRVDMYQPWPVDLSSIEHDNLTPTFVLVENNREYGRMRGYPGEEYFWILLAEMLEEMDKTLATSPNN